MVYGRSALKIDKGGDVSAAIENLVEAGFLAELSDRAVRGSIHVNKRVFIGKSGRINPETGRELRERRFRIHDNYARFYLKCVEPNKRIIDDGAFSFTSLDQLEGWDSIMGLAFENMVVNNYRELIPHLHLGGAVIVSAGPCLRRAAKGPRGHAECQVDLLVQTRRTICIVEIKRKREIRRETIDEVDAKVRAIRRPVGVLVRAALVYDGHLSPLAASDGYFDAIVPFDSLLRDRP